MWLRLMNLLAILSALIIILKLLRWWTSSVWIGMLLRARSVFFTDLFYNFKVLYLIVISHTVINYKCWLVDIQMMLWRSLCVKITLSFTYYCLIWILYLLRRFLLSSTIINIVRVLLTCRFLAWGGSFFHVFIPFFNLFIKTLFIRTEFLIFI
jgi:hypothetical protein